MLKLTVSPGDFIMIGEEIKIIFAGGENRNIPIGIEAPKNIPIIRNTAKYIRGFENMDMLEKPYVEKGLSDEAKKKITAIVAEDRWRNKKGGVESRQVQ